jgi:hypothetical protein
MIFPEELRDMETNQTNRGTLVESWFKQASVPARRSITVSWRSKFPGPRRRTAMPRTVAEDLPVSLYAVQEE